MPKRPAPHAHDRIDRSALLSYEGRYREAEQEARRALADAGDPETVAEALNVLGVSLKGLGRYGEASRAYRRAMRIVEMRRSPLEPVLYHNLAGLAHAQRRYARAEPLARTGLRLRASRDGTSTLAYASDLGALAAIVDGRRRHNNAQRLYRRAIAIIESHEGPEASELAVHVGNLAASYASSRRLMDAEAHYVRALELAGKRLPLRATLLNNFGMLRRWQRRYDESIALLEEAVALTRKSLGAGHALTSECRANLAYVRGLKRRGPQGPYRNRSR